MPLKTSSAEELPSLNLTPMIDVVFLLIIFFMVGTQFTEAERPIDLKLPAAGELKTMIAPPDRREIVVSAEGQVYFEGRKVSLDELSDRLRQLRASYPDLRAVVRADEQVKLQHVIAVYGAAERAGLGDISMAARYRPQILR